MKFYYALASQPFKHRFNWSQETQVMIKTLSEQNQLGRDGSTVTKVTSVTATSP